MATREQPVAAAVRPIPENYHTVTPYLVVPGLAKLIDFLKQAFGATEIGRFEQDGRIMHAEVKIGDSLVMMGEPHGDIEARPAVLHLYVEDVDATYRQALQAGGTSLREPADQFYGDRSGGVMDPSRNQWWISTHVEDVSPEEMRRRMQVAGH
jgi:PhnB protein